MPTILNAHEHSITTLPTFSKVVLLEIESLFREPVQVGDIMYCVHCIEGIDFRCCQGRVGSRVGTCRPSIIENARAGFRGYARLIAFISYGECE
jgi:hypothetical protein